MHQPFDSASISGDSNIASILATIGESVEDAAEETFTLFSQDLPQNDLGIIDPEVNEIEIEIKGHEYSINQSAGLLRSTRDSGTTGAMVWKVTPRVARWLASDDNLLFRSGILGTSKTVVELGCGVAGIIGMAVCHLVLSYTLTDQAYVLKLLKENLERNQKSAAGGQRSSRGSRALSKDGFQNLHVTPFDWELDSVQNLLHNSSNSNIDVVLICDCVYNSYLIEPLTQACIDICRLNSSKSTVVLIAQQLRTNDVMEEWLTRFLEDFHIWRIKDDLLPLDLRSSSGYIIHIGMLCSS